MVIVISSPFAGKAYCLDEYMKSVEGILKTPNIDFKYVIYDNSCDKEFSNKLRKWSEGLGIPVIWYSDLNKPTTIESTADYALTSNKVVQVYKVIFEKLIPECDYVLNIEDDTTCEPDALEKLLGTMERNPSAVTVVGSVYGRRLNDRYFGVPVVFAFKGDWCYPQFVGFNSKVTAHRVPERESGEEFIGSSHVALWLTKYEILKEKGWEVVPELGVAGDISWGYRNLGKMMINWGVRAKHWFKCGDGTADYHGYGHNGGMPSQFECGIINRGSPQFINGVQIAR